MFPNELHMFAILVVVVSLAVASLADHNTKSSDDRSGDCIHGTFSPDENYCRCHQGWYGENCDIDFHQKNEPEDAIFKSHEDAKTFLKRAPRKRVKRWIFNSGGNAEECREGCFWEEIRETRGNSAAIKNYMLNYKCTHSIRCGSGYFCAATNNDYSHISRLRVVCRRHGGWSAWSNWGPYSGCSKSCGTGIKTRYSRRTCTNPTPVNGGNTCSGPSTQSQSTSCYMRHCPVNGGWSDFSSWSSCSVTCGIGNQFRDRTCTNPVPLYDGSPCSGGSRESRLCNTNKSCPIDGGWSKYTEWTECSVTCGTGKQSRIRSCNNPPPQHGGKDCQGSKEEIQNCDTHKPCPVNGGWSEYLEFSKCSVTCGVGEKSRSRKCNNPAPQHGGSNCTGNAVDIQKCDTHTPCPVDGGWSEYSEFSKCSVTCEVGEKSRSRKCNNPAPQHGGSNCTGNDVDIQKCDTQTPCPVDGGWSEFSEYSECSVTCGVGEKARFRKCNSPAPQYGGSECEGNATERQSCDTRTLCPELNPCTDEETKAGNSHHPHPFDEHKFVQCDEDGSNFVKDCPPPLVWNQEADHCGWVKEIDLGDGSEERTTTKSVTDKNPNPCTDEEIKSGNFHHPHPFDKHKYIQCDENGGIWVKECAPPLIWNQDADRCDWEKQTDQGEEGEVKENSEKTEKPVIDSDMETTTKETEPKPTENIIDENFSNLCTEQETRAGNFHHPHPLDTSKYIQCDGNGGSWVKDCPPPLVWNQDAKGCSWAQ